MQHQLPSLSILVIAGLVASSALAEEILINTSFATSGAAITSVPAEAQSTPLEFPTSIGLPRGGEVAIEPAEEDLYQHGRNFAVFKVGDTPARAAIEWQLPLNQQGGIYEIAFQFLPLEPIQNGARLRLVLRDPSNKPVEELAGAGMVAVANGRILGRTPVIPGELYKIMVRVDFNAGEWVAWSEGDEPGEPQAFPEGNFNPSSIRLVGVVFEAAGVQPTPNTSFALGSVKLTKLD
jgi:hypothetical protein